MLLPDDNTVFWIGEILGIFVFLFFFISFSLMELTILWLVFWIVVFWIVWTGLVSLAIFTI